MARTSQIAQVGKRKIDLSNLNKVLYPADNIIKAEVVEYYFKAAPTILRHLKGRALSLVRYPDGIYGEKFFQKNRPDWAPDWIEYITLGKEKKDYIIATEEASLVWLANLACLELHQMHSRKPNFDKPDYMVFDLDPPENVSGGFQHVAEIAVSLRENIENFGYHPFVKTTGGKGIHIICPIEPKYDFHKVFEAAEDIAKPFVEKHTKDVTLHIRKDARKGRILVDIYRIRSGQSIISAYSLRGTPGAPVSMPLTWERLEKVNDPKEFDIHNAVKYITDEGDAWEGIDAYAVEIHAASPPTPLRRRGEIKSQSALQRRAKLRPSKKYKAPEQLEKYSKKRDFAKTPEPGPGYESGKGNLFVVHRHHASRLHYDLRLEKDGVLKSWAVPKGLPPAPAIKHLAVQTEDHPVEYLKFEGTIPKGEYGGGDMWVYISGKYEITKEKKDGSLYFRLNSPSHTGEYRMYKIGGSKTESKDWLMERVDRPQVDWLHDIIEPMLSQSRRDVPETDSYLYEVKWDGIRVMISLNEDKITLRSRNHIDITSKFPELLIPEKAFRATNGLFDGEIVCLDEEGHPNFQEVIYRMQRSGSSDIQRAMNKYPACCYLFDCLYLDGRAIVNEPLLRRREWLKDAVKKGTPYRVSESVEDGKGLFDAIKKLGLEGIIAKQSSSKYLPGKRSDAWYKIKVKQTAEAGIIGYTKGKGGRVEHFGALHLGQNVNGQLEYRGKVGTGFDTKIMREIMSAIGKVKEIKKPIQEKVIDEKMTVWVEPKLFCEIEYASMTNEGAFRAAVFVRMRPDLSPVH